MATPKTGKELLEEIINNKGVQEQEYVPTISRAEDQYFTDENSKGYAYGELGGGVMRAIPSATRGGFVNRLGSQKNLEFNSSNNRFDNISFLDRYRMLLEGVTDQDIAKERRRLKKKDLERKGVYKSADNLTEQGYNISPNDKSAININSNAVDFDDLESGVESAKARKELVNTYETQTGKKASDSLKNSSNRNLTNITTTNKELIDKALTREDLGLGETEIIAQTLLNDKIRDVTNARSITEADETSEAILRRKYGPNIYDSSGKLKSETDLSQEAIRSSPDFQLREDKFNADNSLRRAEIQASEANQKRLAELESARINLDSTIKLGDLDLQGLKLQLETETANRNIDRLNKIDERDYAYRIRKDNQDRMDDIFKLLLGGTQLLF